MTPGWHLHPGPAPDSRGRYRVGHRTGPEYHEVLPWTAHEAIAVPAPGDAGRNVLVVEARPDRLVVTVNGAELTSFEPPSHARFDGIAGLRALDGGNLHVTRLQAASVADAGEKGPRTSS